MTADELGQQPEGLHFVEDGALDAGHVGQRGVRGDVAMWPSTIDSAGIGTASTINAPVFAARFSTFSMSP